MNIKNNNPNSHYSLKNKDSLINNKEQKTISCGNNNNTHDCTYQDIIWPFDKHDYDCDQWEMYLPETSFRFNRYNNNANANDNANSATDTTTKNLYYDGKYNDPLLTDYYSSYPNKNNNNNAQNLCNNHKSKEFQKACPSHRCLLTEDTIRKRLPLDSSGSSSHSRYENVDDILDSSRRNTEIYRKACCAWDELIYPSGDSSLHNPPSPPSP